MSEDNRNRGGRPAGREFPVYRGIRLTPEQDAAVRAVADREYGGSSGAVIRALIDLHLRARPASAA